MSLHLKSRRNCPPNGFQFHQRETGWKLETWDFEQLCQELLKHRQANPQYRLSVSIDVIREEVDVQNAKRVSMMPNTESYLQDFPDPGASPPKQIPSQRPGRSVAAVVGKLKSGYDLLKEWKETGELPAPQATSTLRASICASCPLNSKSDLTRFFTVPVAREVQGQIEDFHDMKLMTPFDDKLGVCDGCICPLRLKVHAPEKLIIKHTKPETLKDLAPQCWIPPLFK